MIKVRDNNIINFELMKNQSYHVNDLSDNLLLSIDFNGNNIIQNYEGVNEYDDCEDFTLTGTTFNLIKIKENIFNGDIENTTFKGGFYQSAYKLEGYDYNVLPDNFQRDFAAEFWLRKENYLLDENLMNINEIYPDNSNFFFYLGLKKENEYCGYEVTGMNCSGVLYNELPEIIETTITGSTLLHYNQNTICEDFHRYEVLPKNCDDSVIDNVFGVRFTEDDRINVRTITSTGECIGSNVSIINYYSEQVIWKEWNNVIITFKPYDDCVSLGVLYIWFNGFRVMHLTNFKMIEPYPLDIDKSLQIETPFNMSIGGGSLGNMCNDYQVNDDENIVLCEYELCFNECIGLTGVTVGGEFVETNFPIKYNEKELLIEFLQMQTEGIVDVYVQQDYTKIFITTDEELGVFCFTDDICEIPMVNKCTTYIPNVPANLIEKNFAGTFIGEIDCFNLYNTSVNLNEVNVLSKGKLFTPDKCCF